MVLKYGYAYRIVKNKEEKYGTAFIRFKDDEVIKCRFDQERHDLEEGFYLGVIDMDEYSPGIVPDVVTFMPLPNNQEKRLETLKRRGINS